MPFEFLEPGVVRLTIPDTGWELSDRKAFALAVTRSCASGPTGLILESNTRAGTEAGPNHMLDLLDQLRESITCIGAEFTCPSSRRLKATWCCERCSIRGAATDQWAWSRVADVVRRALTGA